MALYLRKKLDNKAEIAVWHVTETEEEFQDLYSFIKDAKFDKAGVFEYSREKTYPTYYPINTKLEDEKTTVNNNERTYIMTYKGDVNYTIIEQEVIKQDQERTTFLDGDIYVLGDSVAIVNNNIITFFQSGMEYTVASTQVQHMELLKMAYSLIVYQEK